MIEPCSIDGVKRWLAYLGMLCAGGAMTAHEANLRATAYATLLEDRPGYWFTKATLKAAGEHFKWFPSAAEVIEFLRTQTGDRNGQVDAARGLVNAPLGQQPRQPFEPEPREQRLGAIAASYLKHFGPDDPRTIRAQREAGAAH